MQAPEAHVSADDGRFPNSTLPALIYRGVLLEEAGRASAFERMFTANLWPAAWRNSLYTRHHYHSTAHEVLGIAEGWVKARLGGESGAVLTLHAGDVLVIPAGVAHCNEGQSRELCIVGAYPRGTEMDMNYGAPGERPAADRRIAAVPLPERDPVQGAGGALLARWRG